MTYGIKKILIPVVALVVLFSFPTGTSGREYKTFEEPLSHARFWDLRLAELLPEDAVEYVNGWKLCIHWSGEIPYDKERAKEIENNSKKDCAVANW